ncbi:uncharacterized protein [Scyliorhinus torazame]|uniref:uncharacterized protein isoform X2 n=1 Tax=Scyliorhinus torazame TaxID=75743 RepID=UPI003B58C790
MTAAPDRPCYFSFVNSVRLWHRGQSSAPPTFQPDSTRPSIPCPRFIAHMNTSSSILHSPWDLNFRPRTIDTDPSNIKPSASSRDVWKTTVYPRHKFTARSICHVPFKLSTKGLPKSPPASPASLMEGKEKQEYIQREAILGAGERNRVEELVANTECGSSRVICNVADLDNLGVDEGCRSRESISPLPSGMDGTLSHCSRHTLNVCSQGAGFSLDIDTNRTEMSDRLSNWGGDSSTDLSQFRCSSLSWNSRDSEDSDWNAASSSIHSSRHHLYKDSLEASSLYQSVVNTDLNVSICHSTGDWLQVSPRLVKSSPMEKTPSFIEIWHDRVLRHWPVLPPISTQREILEAWSPESPGQIVDSYSGLSAYEELDGIIPCTGSSLSQRTLDGMTEEVSDSELTASPTDSQTRWDSAAQKSLAEMRLSLMDHQGWDHQHDQLENYLVQATNAESPVRIATGETGEMDGSGFPSHHPSGNSSECKLVSAWSNNEEDKHRNSHTMMTDTLYNKAATSNSLKLSTESSNRQCSTMLTSSIKETALAEDIEHFISTDSSNMGVEDFPLPSVDRVTYLNKELDSISSLVESERVIVASQTDHLRRQTPPGLSHGVVVEIERVRQFQARKAKALRTVVKLRATKPSGVQGSEVKHVSNFEDFNFLEKYSIFNQEELARYKTKFKEVDNDNDGCLSCVEVVMALKEMVPLGALTDSEEIYIYRILESLDYNVIEGLTNFRLFAVMASLAQKITKLDGFMRSLIGKMDFKTLELRVDRAKQLFLCNLESESTTISIQQFLVELKAGGISRVHEEEVRKELQYKKALDLLDFLTYLPLFVLIHNSVVSNPLDDSRTL